MALNVIDSPLLKKDTSPPMLLRVAISQQPDNPADGSQKTLIIVPSTNSSATISSVLSGYIVVNVSILYDLGGAKQTTFFSWLTITERNNP